VAATTAVQWCPRPGPAIARWAQNHSPLFPLERLFSMLHVALRAVVALLLAIGIARPSFGILQFYQVFKAEYLDNHA
jgi:hypothetical protein